MSHSRPEGFPGLPEGWEARSESAPSADGKVSLFVSQFVRKNLPSMPRLLFVLHGQGEHGGRYQHFPAFVDDAVDLVICMDHRGHGRSQGVRGHVDRFDEYVDDAHAVLAATVSRFEQGCAAHLFGHSMGGLIGLLLLQQKSVGFLKSATLSAPLLALKYPVPVAKQLAGHLLSRVLGGLQLETGLDSSLISHDPAVVKAYRSDQLVHSKATARFFTEMLQACSRARGRTAGVHVPVQFIVPMEDGLVDSKATLEFYESLKVADKRLVKYPGFFHESFNEVDKLKAFGDLSKWIRDHH